jgi:uncharacterized protein YhbP (UPF0306 family)
MDTSALLKFLQSQKALAVAATSNKDLWIANVFMGVNDEMTIYFISPEDTKHSQYILANPKVAFSTAWFNPQNHKDRKGIQGQGVCTLATTSEDVAEGVRLHNQNYPEFKKRITVDWVKTNEYKSRVWIIKPTLIKFWNDELYSSAESKEFTF